MATIQINNLSKVFRTELVETVALNGVNLTVEKGELVAIMGPSGEKSDIVGQKNGDNLVSLQKKHYLCRALLINH